MDSWKQFQSYKIQELNHGFMDLIAILLIMHLSLEEFGILKMSMYQLDSTQVAFNMVEEWD
jgi:hypothetical protein